MQKGCPHTMLILKTLFAIIKWVSHEKLKREDSKREMYSILSVNFLICKMRIVHMIIVRELNELIYVHLENRWHIIGSQ